MHDHRRQHRDMVRQLLRWRGEHGPRWVRDWLDQATQHDHDAESVQSLRDDADMQWRLGNEGAAEDWRLPWRA